MAETSARIRSYIIGFGLGTQDFDGQFIGYKTATSDITAKFTAHKNRRNPIITISSVTPPSGVLDNGVKQVSVTVNGTLIDADKWNSTRSAEIHFGELLAHESSVSGFTGPPPWTATHDYNASGIYFIMARGIDNLGMIGSDVYKLNLMSGIDPHADPIHLPYVSISGIPNSGVIPPTLNVSFRTRMRYWQTFAGDFGSNDSNNKRVDDWREREILNTNIPYWLPSPEVRVGPLFTYYTFPHKTEPILYWNFCNGATITDRGRPRSQYYNVGEYAVILRYVDTHPSGRGTFYTGDSLRVNWNY